MDSKYLVVQVSNSTKRLDFAYKKYAFKTNLLMTGDIMQTILIYADEFIRCFNLADYTFCVLKQCKCVHNKLVYDFIDDISLDTLASEKNSCSLQDLLKTCA